MPPFTPSIEPFPSRSIFHHSLIFSLQKMGYGRLGSSDPVTSQSDPPPPNQPDAATSTIPDPKRRLRLLLLLLLSVALIAASAVSAVVLIGFRARASENAGSGPMAHRKPTQAISRACSKTRYPTLCVDSLLDFPGSQNASEPDLVHISVNLTHRRFGLALSAASEVANLQMEPIVRSAFEDCLELLDHSVELLARSLSSTAVTPAGGGSGGGSAQDVMTWLSAALTNQDTCAEGFEGLSGAVRDQMVTRGLQDLSELVSNCLAIFAAVGGGDDFAGVPIQNRRRRRLLGNGEYGDEVGSGYPKWMSREERRLLDAPASKIQADIVVSKDGNGTVKTIEQAIKKAPEHSSRRIIIYIKAGR